MNRNERSVVVFSFQPSVTVFSLQFQPSVTVFSLQFSVFSFSLQLQFSVFSFSLQSSVSVCIKFQSQAEHKYSTRNMFFPHPILLSLFFFTIFLWRFYPFSPFFFSPDFPFLMSILFLDPLYCLFSKIFAPQQTSFSLISLSIQLLSFRSIKFSVPDSA